DVIFGSFGALLAAAWSFLAIFLADLARDDDNPSPVQAKSSAIYAFFLFIGSFSQSYIRAKLPRCMSDIKSMIIMMMLS
ncbi:hypothetical protein BCR43DRAFT_422514, partial [Syncephalastrum racemosum]